MAKLTEEMVTARTRASDLSLIKKLNCWGGELQDISLLRRMSNVEVLSLSVNKISTLVDVQYCKNLKELYVRKNEIKNLNEICYLKDLHNLKALWLGENPCSLSDPLYRMTVIRNLPGLEKLDDVKIEPEERQDAMKKGRDLIHPEDFDYTANSSPESSPSRNVQRSPPVSSRCSEPDFEEMTGGSRKSYSPDYEPHQPQQQQQHSQQNYVSAQESRYSNDRYENRNSRRSNDVIYDQNSYDNGVSSMTSEKYSSMQTSSYTPRYTESYANNKKESSESRNTNFSTNHQDIDVEYRQESKDSYCVCPTHQCDRPSQIRSRESRRGSSSEGSGRLSPQKGHMDDLHDAYSHHNERSYRQYEPDSRLEVLERQTRAFSYPNRRPVTRNSNLLSAVLCLIKELDYPSLEVVGIAVRCRMDEFDD